MFDVIDLPKLFPKAKPVQDAAINVNPFKIAVYLLFGNFAIKPVDFNAFDSGVAIFAQNLLKPSIYSKNYERSR